MADQSPQPMSATLASKRLYCGHYHHRLRILYLHVIPKKGTMLLAKTLVAVTALAQFAFMLAEMFRWPKVAELLTKMSPTCVKESEALGANMGLYNGFLAAGLLWSLLAPDLFGRQLALFFVTCVVAAAAYGAWSINKLLLLIQ